MLVGMQATTKYANLDLFRALAVLAVYVDHVNSVLRGPGSSPRLWMLGRAGILIFFVHTAYVLMMSMERTHGEKSWALRFYVRRAFRIYPLSLFFIALVIGVLIPLGNSPTLRWTKLELLTNIPLLQNLWDLPSIQGNMWTLPFEIEMYFVLPLLSLLLVKRGSIAVLAAILFSGCVLGYVQMIGLIPRPIFGFVPCFLGGVVAYYVRKRSTIVFPAWSWPPVLIGYGAGFILLAPPYPSPLYEWMFCLVLGCFTPLFANLGAPWIVWLSNWVATYSYGIYLAHYVVLWTFLRYLVLPPAVAWLGVAAFSIAFPAALYHFLEHPMIELGKRVTATGKASTSQREAIEEEAGTPVP